MSIGKLGAATIKEIKALEQENNLSLPNDYIHFLLKYNGGIIDKEQGCQVFAEGLNGIIHIDILYGIHTAHQNANIGTWMDMFRDEMLFGSLIIGDSIEHGFIILMCIGDMPGIYYWDHTYEFPNSNDERNTYYITDTFTDFAKGLF